MSHEARRTTEGNAQPYSPRRAAEKIAEKAAEGMGLPACALDGFMKGVMGGKSGNGRFFGFPNLKICTVAPECLLAMKFMASKHGAEDREGIAPLMKRLGLDTGEKAVSALLKLMAKSRCSPRQKG
jgi:hypothetical protein